MHAWVCVCMLVCVCAYFALACVLACMCAFIYIKLTRCVVSVCLDQSDKIYTKMMSA